MVVFDLNLLEGAVKAILMACQTLNIPSMSPRPYNGAVILTDIVFSIL